MPILQPDHLEVVERPEIVIGLAAAVGTPINHVQRLVTRELEACGYQIHEVRLSYLIAAVDDALNYLQRESTAALVLSEFVESEQKEFDFDE